MSRRGKPEYATHGTMSGYQWFGCRCDACREAVRSYNERWRRSKGQRPIAEWNSERASRWSHGTVNGYVNKHCRCDECCTAHTKYLKERGIGGYARDLCGCGGTKLTVATKCSDCYRAEVTKGHGVIARYRQGCRCEECRAASADARRSYRRRYPEKQREYDMLYKARTR